MERAYILNDDDLVLPTDYCRPLLREADVLCHSSEWVPENTYGGGPNDTLLWYPIWLSYGAHMWNKPVSAYQYKHDNYIKHYEILRGKPNIRSTFYINTKYIVRHPLFQEYAESIKTKDDEPSPVKSHKGKSIAEAFKYENRSTIKWYLTEYCIKYKCDIRTWLWLYERYASEMKFWHRDASEIEEFKRITNQTIHTKEIREMFSNVCLDKLNDLYVK